MVRILGPAETAGAAIADDGVVEGVVATNAADHGSGQQVPIDPVLSSEGTLIITQHGKGWDGDDAFCRRDTDGLVDCQACLSTAKAALVRATTSEEVKLVNEILDELHIAGEEGLGKTRIMASHIGIIMEAYIDRHRSSKSPNNDTPILLGRP